ncbi:MAG TPA: sigma-70 family RNA polymerase sigma factor [Candidatus Syntrophosphaera sp.]|nr:sigma-70 family RNA polymerase sigma factor [Candidatus Syntrophosphaera sp.]
MDSSKPKNSSLHSLLAIQDLVRERALREFGQPIVAAELANRISLKQLQPAGDDTQPGQLPEALYSREVEAYFEELREVCCRYARKLLQDKELVEDICQDCLRELLTSTQTISNVKAWLCRVAHNKIVARLQGEKKRQVLCRELKLQNLAPPCDPEYVNLDKCLDRKDLRRLLSRSDYAIWSRMRLHRSLKAYATTENISYSAAKERRHRIRINLRSAWLKEQGWEHTDKILSYDELRAIRRFIGKIQTLFETPSSRQSGQPSLGTLPSDLAEAFSGATKLNQWTIRQISECSYSIIVVADSEADPITVRIEISLNRTNRVRVVQFKRYLLVAAIPTSGKKVITEEKGGPQINYKELLALVPQARVLHPEEFQKILNHMKNRT